MVTKSNESKNAKMGSKLSKGKIIAGVGIVGAIAAASLGGYFFYKTPKGKKKIDAIKAGIESWAHKAKHDIVANVKKLKNVNKDVYHQVVDAVLAKYQTLKNLSPNDIKKASEDLKKYWNHVQKEIHKIKNSVTKSASKSSVGRKKTASEAKPKGGAKGSTAEAK